jgi:hypothetical protein
MPGVLAALGVPGARDALGLASALDGVRRVAVLLVDGLGYQLLPLAAPVAPVLADAHAGRLGQLRALTAPFPSTTPVSLASVGTGLPPGGHGLMGFTVRVPGTDRVLNHIAWGDDPDPRRWQPAVTQFDRAGAAGVSVSVVARSEYAGSGLTTAAYRGAAYRPADGPDEVATGMLAALPETGPPALVYGYLPELDLAGHLWGVDSARWRDAAGRVDAAVARLVDGLPDDAALVVVADHGQLDVPASHRFDLDADPRLRTGVETVAGEPRVRFLHARPGATGDVIAAWREVLGDAAWVAEREQVVAGGWFGQVTDAHRARIGDVVVACRDRYAVLATAHEPDRVSRLVAYHGSWTAVEMLVPLWVVRAADR